MNKKKESKKKSLQSSASKEWIMARVEEQNGSFDLIIHLFEGRGLKRTPVQRQAVVAQCSFLGEVSDESKHKTQKTTKFKQAIVVKDLHFTPLCTPLCAVYSYMVAAHHCDMYFCRLRSRLQQLGGGRSEHTTRFGEEQCCVGS